MRILRARHMGMCFGVRKAVAAAVRAAADGPLTVLGDLVHNDTVLADLERRGVRFERDVEAVDTQAVMVTAHGASARRRAEVERRGLQMLDATCPLVAVAHRALASLVREGYHPVVIGKAGHVEVSGLTEDLEAFDVVADAADVMLMRPRDRFGVVAQTTQPVARVNHLASLIRLRFPNSEVRLVDTVCAPTKQRQESAAELARACDVVIVVGGAASNNTRELVATCAKYCQRVYQVQSRDDLRADWLDGAAVAGLTAGTSTPDAIIDAVEERMRSLAARQAA